MSGSSIDAFLNANNKKDAPWIQRLPLVIMEFTQPDITNICAVIITMNPDSSFPDRIKAIRDQVPLTIIVDNKSSGTSLRMLRGLTGGKDIYTIFNDKNLGIAAALNKGVSLAKEKGYAWAITFDQDSQAERCMVRTFLETFPSIATPSEIAVMGCNHIDINNQQQYVKKKNVANQKGWISRTTVITSGSLMSLQIFDLVGPFREEFFLDGVDHEYCLRCRRNRYEIGLILKSLLRHSMGNKRDHKVFFLPFLKISSSNYLPFRWYYITRNRLILVREYLIQNPIWATTHFVKLFLWIAITIILERDRVEKIKYILQGIGDAIGNRYSREIIKEPSSS